jgi:hypothetical protein
MFPENTASIISDVSAQADHGLVSRLFGPWLREFPRRLSSMPSDLVPVLPGSGVRFLDELKAAPILLDGPDQLVKGSRVTHLRYQLRRS